MLNRSMLVNINIKSRNSELFSFHLLFYSLRCWLTCVNQGGECVRKLLRHCGGKTRHVIWKLSFVQESRNLIICKEWGNEDNLGYDYLYGQVAKAQSATYYCLTQRHTGVNTYRQSCTSGPKCPYYWGGEGGKVSRPCARKLKIPRATKVTPIVIGALGTISKRRIA